jgi:hypothetical protein
MWTLVARGGVALFLALLLGACGFSGRPQPDFTISLNPANLNIQQGSSGTTQLTITPQNGFTGTVALSLVAGQDQVPQGLTLSPGSVQVSGSGPVNQSLTLSAQPTTPTGTYRLKVRATSESLTREADLAVAVAAPPPSPGFTLALNPTSLTVQQGSNGQTTLTVTPQNGFTGTVALSLAGAPGGVTLSPASVAVSGSGPVAQALTLSVDEGVAPGTYPLQVRGAAGGHVQEVSLSLTVTAAPPPFTGTLDLPSPLQTVAPGGQVQVPVRVAFNGSRVASVTLTVRLADPCAKGTSDCPGWDASRYPGVTHPTGSFTLTPTSPGALLTFRVDPGALPQGPFKYELVLSGRGASGKVWEEVVPFYLKVLRPGERSGMEAWNFWRDYMDLPRVTEDPEWSFRAWLHSRYALMNYPNNFVYDEDLSQPFASPEGREAGRRGNEWGWFAKSNGQPYWPTEETSINWWISSSFHRFNVIDPRAVNGGFGVYRDVGPVPGWGDGWGRTWANLPNLYGGSPGTRPQLFPVPDKAVPLNQHRGQENPNPTAPCSNPSRPQVRPFLTREGLTWDDGNGAVVDPIGLPLSLQTFPSAPVDTEVLEARLVRLSDGVLNPLCAYGSLQYWEGRDPWRQTATLVLRNRGAVVALPHQPLTPGEAYEAYLKVRLGGEMREFTWRFSVAAQNDLRPLRVEPSLELQEGR